jgi:hypothetical protein
MPDVKDELPPWAKDMDARMRAFFDKEAPALFERIAKGMEGVFDKVAPRAEHGTSSPGAPTTDEVTRLQAENARLKADLDEWRALARSLAKKLAE